jgi:hypothetical protein
MVTQLSAVLTTLTLLAALWALLKVVLDRPLLLERREDQVLLGSVALVELLLLAQAVVGFVLLATTDREVAGVTFGAYLVGLPLILPIAVWWALGDRSRAGAGVLIVGLVTVPAMILRMHQIWDTSAV